MYEDSIKLLLMPEHDSISVCVYNENDDLFALSQRINERFEEAYMNGYNWDALIRHYVGKLDPGLMAEVESDPEAGMYSGYMSYSEANIEKMKQFEAHIRTMLADEAALMAHIEANLDEIEWD